MTTPAPRFTPALLSALLPVLLAAGAHADEPRTNAAAAEPGLVRVLVTFQDANQFLPWLTERPRERGGYAVRISPDRFLTTEHVLRNQRLVELQRARSGEKVAAVVELADPQANLALLKLRDPAALAGLEAVALAEATPRAAELEILQFFDTGELQRFRAPVTRVSMARLPDSPYSAITFTLQSETSVNGEGAPALHDGRLAGLAMTYDRGARTAGIVPHPVIRRFLDDALQPPYTGFAAAGFTRTELVDPVKRAYLGVTRSGLGVQVLQVLPGTAAAEQLKPGDVIVEWDGRPIDNLGFYADPDFGRIDFTYLIKGRRLPGDTVPATIVRGRAEQTVQVRLDARSEELALIPDDVEGKAPEYLVEGGFVLRELSGKYLQAHGSDWVRNLDTRLAHLYLARQHDPSQPGERVVVISAILSDPVNVGYQHLRNQIVRAVNGEPVRNLADVFRVARRDGHISRFSLQGIGLDIVLEAGLLPEANARLAKAYRIPRLRFQRPAANEPARTPEGGQP